MYTYIYVYLPWSFKSSPGASNLALDLQIEPWWIHTCIVLVLVCAFFNDIMLHKNYSHNWIYDVSFSMPVCIHTCILLVSILCIVSTCVFQSSCTV